MNMEIRRDAINDKTKSLGFRVLLSRRDLGWDQETLACNAGISRGYISKLERGYTKNPGIEVIKALAKALGISTEYLMGSTDDPLAGVEEETKEAKFFNELQFQSAAIDPKTFHLLQRLIAIFNELSPRDRAVLLRLAETLRHVDTLYLIEEDHSYKAP